MSKRGWLSIAVLGGFLLHSLLWLALPSPARAADLAGGEAIYKGRCAVCHGKDGRGDGPAGKAFNPKPTAFADPASFKGLTDADLKKLIVEGKPPMPAFKGSLKDQEVDSVVAFIKSLPARAKK